MKRVLTVLAIILLLIITLVGVLIWGVQTPAGQNFLTTQAAAYLRNKLNTKVEIKGIRFDIPDWIALEGVYIEDLKGDTLVAGERLRVDLDMWSLIRGKIGINKVELDSVRVKVDRALPDTTFNFQFIVDAFDSGAPADTTPSEPMDMRLDEVSLKNVRLTYVDAVIGTDADAVIKGGQVKFSAFNPDKSQYHTSDLVLTGSAATVRMYKGLQVEKEVASAAGPVPEASDSLDVKVGRINIQDFKWAFIDETSGINNKVTVGALQGEVEKTYLTGQRVAIKNVTLTNTTGFLEFAKQQNAKVVPAKGKSVEPTTIESPGWNIQMGSANFSNNSFRYDDFNAPKLSQGMDYSHLNIQNLNVKLNKFIYSTDSTAGSLENASFRDRSGFVLQQLTTDFAYASRQTYLRNLYLKTPSTVLRDKVELKYRSQEQLTQDIGKVAVNVNLTNSRVGFEDVLLLVPDLKKTPPFADNPKGNLTGTAVITGTVNNLLISKANFTTLSGTNLNVKGRITGLPNSDKLGMNLSGIQMNTTKSDLEKLVPKGSLPASVQVPDKIGIVGNISGTIKDLKMDAAINTTFGNGSFEGILKNITDTKKAEYDGTLGFKDFDLGKLLKQPPTELGKISLVTNVKGHGLDTKTMEATLSGTVQSASVKGYEYNNLTLTGGISKGVADIVGAIKDENIALELKAQADLNAEYPAVKANADIAKIDLNALHLYADKIVIKGAIDVNLTSTDPANPLGTVNSKDLVIEKDGKPIPIQNFDIELKSENGTRIATIDAPFLKANLNGQFDYVKLGDILVTELNKYFTVADSGHVAVTDPYTIDLNVKFANHEALQAFAPQLTKLDTASLAAHLSNNPTEEITLKLSIPVVEYDSIKVTGVAFDLKGDGKKADYTTNIAEVLSGGFRVRRASLNGDIENNNLDFDLTVKDSLDKNRHNLAARIAFADDHYRFNLRRGLLLDYNRWRTDSLGYVQYGKDGVLAKNLTIQRRKQRIVINSETQVPNSPIKVVADSIGIKQFVMMFMNDSTLVDGRLDADIVIKDYMEKPSFSGDVSINGLKVTQIPVGNMELHATNENPDRIAMKAALSGNDNDIRIDGNYILDAKDPFDFTLDLKKLSAKTIEAFSFGELRRASGAITGKVTLQGSTENPKLNGDIKFDNVAFNVKQLGTTYKINDRTIAFKNQDVLFNKFIVTDTLGRELEVNGAVTLTDIPNVGYNLTIRAKNFTVLNATRKDNEMYYGKGSVDANLRLKGKGSEVVIDGSIKILKGANITLILPNDAGGAEDGEGIVKFVDMSDPNSQEVVDSSKVDTGFAVDFASEISLNVEVDDGSEFTVVVDELNGDNLKIKGNAQLNTGIAPNGQLYLLGLYELTEGSYDLTFEVLKKQFKILKGSTLMWTGDPLKADLDIRAAYEVNVDLSALDPEGAEYGNKVPINVILKIQGNLSQPTIIFDLEASDKISGDNKKKIDEDFFGPLRQNTVSMNKQVFSLLILNKFISDQSSDFFSGINPESIARQSVSQLLSDQLNMLASDLIKGVNLDFNLNSENSGTSSRTDLNVGLSKAFLNDRLTVSVGRNFELENTGNTASSTEIFDNLAVNYALSKDGRYMFRAYRKNQFQTVLEGFLVETGVSFIVTLEYDKVREIFRRQQQQ